MNSKIILNQVDTKAVISKAGKKKKPVRTAEEKRVDTIAQMEGNMQEYCKLLTAQRPDVNYELITDLARLETYYNKIIENGIVALDTEGTGLDPIDDHVVGVSLYTPGENPVYIPCDHTNYDRNIDVKPFLEKITTDSIDNGLKVIMANGKFDIRCIRNTFNMDRYIKVFWDCILASKFLNENEKSHGLKNLWNTYVLGDVTADVQSYTKLFGKFGFGVYNPDVIYYYPAMDGLETYEVFKFQEPFLTATSQECKDQDLVGAAWLFNEIEMPLAGYLAMSEDMGFKIDLKYAKELEEKYEKELTEILADFNTEIGKVSHLFDLLNVEQMIGYAGVRVNDGNGNMVIPADVQKKIDNKTKMISGMKDHVNPSSPIQLSILFYDCLHMSNTKKTRGTGVDIIEELKKSFPKYADLLGYLLEYRRVAKLLNTYIKKIPEKEVKASTGKVHCNFNQYGAATGRFSSNKPNLQNIPARNKEIRKMFIPSEGYYLISSDYSQQEPRCLAELSKDQAMIDAYTQGKDLYADMASTLYGVTYDECLEFASDGTKNPAEYKQRRTNTKSVLLGIMYGRGANSIAEQIGLSKEEAKNVIEKFNKDFPNIKKFEQEQQKKCRRFGYVKTIWGRKRRLPDLNLSPFEITGAITEDGKQIIIKDLKNTWNFNDRKEKIYHYSHAYNVTIKDNRGFIAQAERQTLNSVIQGSAADITKIAMVRLYEDKRLQDLGVRVISTVHDEVICEAPIPVALESMNLITDIMRQAVAYKIKIPMKCDGEILDKWSGKDLSEEMV